jgi:PAS domain S-box-containing protein
LFAAFDHAPVGLVLADGDGNWLQANARALECCGLAADQLPGLSFYSLACDAADAARIACCFSKLRERCSSAKLTLEHPRSRVRTLSFALCTGIDSDMLVVAAIQNTAAQDADAR